MTGITGTSRPMWFIMVMSKGRRLWGAMKYRQTSTRVSSKSDMGRVRSLSCGPTCSDQDTVHEHVLPVISLHCQSSDSKIRMLQLKRLTVVMSEEHAMYLFMIHVRHVALTNKGQDGICLRSFIMESW